MKQHISSGRILAALALLLLLPGLTFGSLALEESEAFYVNDAANVLSPETESWICDENWRFYDLNQGAEVVVVTVDFLDGLNAEEYSYKIFNDWNLGDPDEDNGVLILLCPGEEKYWVMTGKGLQQDLGPAVLQTLIDQWLEPAFAEQDYDRAALAIFKAVTAEIDEKYGVTAAEVDAYWGVDAPVDDDNSGFVDDGSGYEESGGSDLLYGIIGLITMIVIIAIVIWVIRALLSIGKPRTYIGSAPKRSFWDRGPAVRPKSRPMSPPPASRPRSGGFFGGFGGSTSSRSTRSSFGGSSRSGSSRSSSSRSSFGGSRSSGGGRRGGGGSSRGGGAGRR